MVYSIKEKKLHAHTCKKYPQTCPSTMTKSAEFLLFTIVFLHPFSLSLSLLFLIFFLLFFFKKAVQSTFRMEEMYHSVSQQLDDERKRRSTTVQTLAIAKDSNADLRQKLKAEEQARKSSDAAIKSAETQAESQRKRAKES